MPGEASETPVRRRRGRILLSLLAVLVVVALVPLATVAWKLIDINRDALTTAQQEYQLLLASSIAREVDIRVQSLRDRVSGIAQTLGSSALDGGRVRHGTFRHAVDEAITPEILLLRFTDVRGRTMTSDETPSLPPAIEELFGAALGDVAAAMERDRAQGGAITFLSRPIVMTGQGPDSLVLLSAPVVARGSFQGVVSALVDFQSVWDALTGTRNTGHTIFAMDPRGELFASSDAVRLPPGTDVRDTAIVQRFMTGRGRARETMPFAWSTDGVERRFMGSYEVTREGWGIFVEAEEQQVYLPVRTAIESTMSWALGALGVAILIAIGFARSLSNPIGRLVAASRAFAAGDFRARVDVRSRNEIGELADTFNSMADEIRGHIDRLRRAAQENSELFLSTIRVLANAIDAKDPYTRGHSVRVNRYSVILARAMGLSRGEIERIHVASVLHDIGKIGIDDSILKKPGALTAEEFAVMKTHPVRGAEIMAPIRQMRDVIPGLRSHHERWNGRGYPDGLDGEAIPLMARIIAVADTFDAMTTHRPYQRAFTFADAVARINELKGVGFDEKVVEAFNRAYQAGEFGEQPIGAEIPEAAIA